MERKVSLGTVEVEAREIRSALASARTMTSEEDRVVRLRHGIGVELGAPLPRAAGGNEELEDELTFMELELFRALRSREGKQRLATSKVVALREASRSRTKEKIVRALRKKR